MINYHAPLFRPPSEADNLIIQATLGCSNNRCTFCSMYRSKPFTARPLPDIFKDIDLAAADWPDARRIFLADGDALVMPTDDLLAILEYLAARLPRLTRVSCYALPANLLNKSTEELMALQQAKLTLLYYGIETGHPPLLKIIRKGATREGMIEGLIKADSAGMKVSATVILGLGGAALWREHIEDTASLLNKAPLRYLSTLQLMLEPEQQGSFMARFDNTHPFQFQDDDAILTEQYHLIEQIIHPPRRMIFRSNHASNALALAGNLPRDRHRLLQEIRAVQQGAGGLRPRWMRGL